MTTGEGISPHEQYEGIRAWEDTWAHFQQLAAGERSEIDQRLKQGQIVVVDGPFGVGKNANIMVPIYQQCSVEGYGVQLVFGNYDVPDVAQSIETRFLPVLLKEGEQRLMVIDEFPHMVQENPGSTEHLFRALHDNGVETLLINAERTQARRDVNNRTIIEIGERTGIPVYIHKVQTTHLPPDLARAHLVNVNQADQDLIDLVTDPTNRALLVPRVFNVLVQNSKTLAELRAATQRAIVSGGEHPGLLEAGQGGSKDALVRALRNIGVNLSDKQIEKIADYD